MTGNDVFPCPSCALTLPLGAAPPACPRCRLPLVGPLAAELAAVDRELAALGGRATDLETRRRQLLVALRVQATPGPSGSPGAAARYGTGPISSTSPMSSTLPVQSTLPIQSTLLGLGALLLAIAGVIFAVVAYGRLGIGGRAAILVGITGLAAAATSVLHRRGLTATADAVGVLTLVLTALDLHALRLLAGSGWDPTAWWALVSAVVAVLGVAAGARLRLAATTAVGVVVGQLCLPLTAVALVDVALADVIDGGRRTTGAVVVVALVLTAVADLTGSRRTLSLTWASRARRLALVSGIGELVASGLFAAGLALDADSVRDAAPGALALLVVAGGMAWAAHLAATATPVPEDVAAPLAGAAGAAALLTATFAVLVQPLVAASAAPGTVLLLPAVLGVVLGLAALRLPAIVRPGPVAVGVATTTLALAGAADVVVAALTAPLLLVDRAWTTAPVPDAPAVVRLVDPSLAVAPADLLLLLLSAVAAGVAARQWPGLRSLTGVCAAGAVVAALLLVPAMAGLPVVLALVGALLVSAALVGVAVGSRTSTPGRPLLVAVPFAATALAYSALDELQTLVTLAVVAVLTGIAAGRSGDVTRVVTAGVAAACALAWPPLAVLAGGGSEVGAGVVLAAVTAVGLLAVDRPAPGPTRITVLGVGALGATLGLLGTVSDPTWLAVVLTGFGVAGLAGALRPGRQALAGAGAGAFTVASWVRLVDLHVTTPEAYTLPSAAVAIVVGEVVRRRRPELDPSLLLGPGLSLALVPSLLVSLTDGGATRPLLLTVGAFATVVAGSSLRLRAPLVIGGAVLAGVAFRQLGPLAVQAPRWVLLGSLGLVLLVLGARYERTRAEVDRLRRSFAELG